MKYLKKVWLDKRKYIAMFDEAMVIVTLDENGKEVRWAIFYKQ